MTSSKYIQLTDKILMEYEYFNSADSTSIERNEFQKSINTNIYTKDEVSYLISNDITEKSTSNFSADNNFYVIKSSQKTYVSRNNGDSQVYTSAEKYLASECPEPEKSTQKITLDKVKIYFTASYNSLEDGTFCVSISSECRTGTFVFGQYILSSFENIPTPFLIGEKLYTRVIEFYVPSPHENQNNLLGTNISLVLPIKIDINFSKILKEESYTFQDKPIKVQNIVNVSSVSINAVDKYATVFANIEEIDDYFKLEGSTKNTWKTFNDFIADLPGNASDYILMHDITVNELLPSSAEPSNADWKITTHNVITQTDNFDEPVLFRPVIKYQNCIACVLDYTLRIYCQANNTQIIKRSTYQNFNFAKYGKKLIKVNLGTSPTQINIYNKLDNDKISNLNIVDATQNMNINIAQEKVFKTSYITSFRDRINIKASIAPVKIDNIVE